ncbi:MAG: NDP-sugar synthase [Marinobacter adhaerens]|uniref:NDP-sugar synthase n=1 Tax=Marinobacter adhaerens TaxID=1033846 RepID=A0A844I169_9GAMM|nr:NDP-sugar synthase [Marinobacter adhaerens]
MKSALIFADRDGSELPPLNDRYCPAMLPVLGKPLLEHSLEHCLSLGIETVYVVLDAHAASVRRYFETGARWSLNIHYVLSRQGESPDRVRRRIGQSLNAPYVAMRGDIWHGLEPNFPRDEGTPKPHRRLGYVVNDAADASIDSLHWQTISRIQIPVFRPDAIDRPCRVYSLGEYHSLALAALSDVFSARDRAIDNPPTTRLLLGAQTRVNHVSLDEGTAFIAEHSRVDIGAQLAGVVSVGRHCLVDRGTRIADSVLLDHTYIGAGLAVKNAIVDQDRIIRVDLNATTTIADSFLLWSNKRPVDGGWLSKALERLIAVCLLPLAALFDFLRRMSAEPRTGSEPGPLRPPLVSRLWAVYTGNIALFGRDEKIAKPLQDSPETPPWQYQYEQLPVGAISPARARLRGQGDLTLLMLTELELNRPRTVGFLAKNLIRCFWSGLKTLLPTARLCSRPTTLPEVSK